MRVCEEYAQKNNILILNTYIDRAMTGTNDNRPDFQRMIKDSSRKEWNYVLVTKKLNCFWLIFRHSRDLRQTIFLCFRSRFCSTNSAQRS